MVISATETETVARNEQSATIKITNKQSNHNKQETNGKQQPMSN